MQPVTIKPEQLNNSLWIVQGLIGLLVIYVVGLAVIDSLWWLFLTPLFVLGLWRNHHVITEQADIQLNMRASGRVYVTSAQQANAHETDETKAELDSFWSIPHVLMLKLKVPEISKPVFITLFRWQIKRSHFSQLLVGLTQTTDPTQLPH